MQSGRLAGMLTLERAPRQALLRYILRLALLVFGLFTFSYGIAMFLGSGVGLSPWDALHQGLSYHLPLTFGQASVLVGGLVILVCLLLRVRPGVATIANMLLVGPFFDLIVANHWAITLKEGPLWAQVLLDLAAVAVVGLGSALYIKAALGAGPRDSLMLALSRLTGLRVGIVRTAIEACALGLGILLGGSFGLGTLIFALGIGPSVDLTFRLFGIPRPQRR